MPSQNLDFIFLLHRGAWADRPAVKRSMVCDEFSRIQERPHHVAEAFEWVFGIEDLLVAV